MVEMDLVLTTLTDTEDLSTTTDTASASASNFSTDHTGSSCIYARF